VIEAFYLVKDSGLPIYTFHQGGNKGSEFDELISPFLTAIDAFSTENFKGKIKAIVLEDGRKLYFRTFKLAGNKIIKFIALADSEHDVDLDGKMINLKWIMEKVGRYLDDPVGGIPKGLEAEIVDQIKNLLTTPTGDGHAAKDKEPSLSDARTRRGPAMPGKRTY
jgi:hypothetical protein